MADKKVYFRAVDTAALPAQLGSHATSNKILLNFVNFENSAETMHVRVTLPQRGSYGGDRFGPGDTFAAAHRLVTLEASPTAELTVALPAGESVQYILTPPGPAPPYPPAVLQAVPEETQVILTWPACSGATQYEVRQAPAETGPFTTVGRELTATRYVARGLTNGQRYCYVVVAGNVVGRSDPSPLASAVAGVPQAPDKLLATPDDRQVTLGWVSSARAEHYQVRRAAVLPGPYEILAERLTDSTYTDRQLTNGDRYFYTLTAVNSYGPSTPSPAVQATPEAAPAAPLGVSATAGDRRVVLQWTASVGAVSYRVQRAAAAGGPFVILDPDCVGTAFTDDDVVNGQTYRYVVSARKIGPESVNSGESSARPEAGAVPAPWKSADIGKVGRPGTASYHPSAQVFTVQGSGDDMWGPTDGAQFVYVPLTGDGSLSAHVASCDATHPYSKIGVMVRETLDTGAVMALVHLSPNGTGFCFRQTTGGKCDMVGGDAQSWLRIVRQGDTMIGYVSADGKTWRPRGTMKLRAGGTVLIGLAVCGHNNWVLNKVLFDHVALEGPAAAPTAPKP